VSDELYEGAFDTGARVPLDLGACGTQEVGFFHQHSDHVDWVFVDHPSYHRAGA
jgi:starch synthase